MSTFSPLLKLLLVCWQLDVRHHCCYSKRAHSAGSTENAGLENEGQNWNSGMKYVDRKMQDKLTGLETAGLEFGGQLCRAGKCRTKNGGPRNEPQKSQLV